MTSTSNTGHILTSSVLSDKTPTNTNVGFMSGKYDKSYPMTEAPFDAQICHILAKLLTTAQISKGY